MPSRSSPSRRRGRPAPLLSTRCAARRRRCRSARRNAQPSGAATLCWQASRRSRSARVPNLVPSLASTCAASRRLHLRGRRAPSRSCRARHGRSTRQSRRRCAPNAPLRHRRPRRFHQRSRRFHPRRLPVRRCRRRIKTSPRWRSGSRPPCAGRPPSRASHELAHRRSPPSRRRGPRRASNRRRPRLRRLRPRPPQRAGLRIWKTRWHHCWVVRSLLREIGVLPA